MDIYSGELIFTGGSFSDKMKEIGIYSVFLGVLLLIIGFIAHWTRSNVFLIVALIFIVGGVVTYALMLRRQ